MFHNPLESLDGYDGDYNKLRHHEIKKLVRKQKLKIISKLWVKKKLLKHVTNYILKII